jgi:hypothetical protein
MLWMALPELPPELLALIFVAFVQPYPLGVPEHRTLNTILGVSSRWRDVALTTPCLWTNIQIRIHADTTHHKLSLIKINTVEQLQRSLPHKVALLLDISAGFPSLPLITDFFLTLIPYLPRLEHLVMRCDGSILSMLPGIYRLPHRLHSFFDKYDRSSPRSPIVRA